MILEGTLPVGRLSTSKPHESAESYYNALSFELILSEKYACRQLRGKDGSRRDTYLNLRGISPCGYVMAITNPTGPAFAARRQTISQWTRPVLRVLRNTC